MDVCSFWPKSRYCTCIFVIHQCFWGLYSCCMMISRESASIWNIYRDDFFNWLCRQCYKKFVEYSFKGQSVDCYLFPKAKLLENHGADHMSRQCSSHANIKTLKNNSTILLHLQSLIIMWDTIWLHWHPHPTSKNCEP